MILSLTLFSNAAIKAGLFGGFALTTEANYGNGIAFGGHLGFELTPNIAVELRATRFSFDVTGSDTGLSNGKMTVMPLELNIQGRLPVGNKLVPYVAVGGGYGLNTFDLDPGLLSDWNAVGMTIEETVKAGLAIFAGLGLDFAIMPGPNPGQGLFINLEARYMMSKTSGSWTLTDQVSKISTGADLKDLKLDTIMFGLGLKYGF
jgi:hypothetical protein